MTLASESRRIRVKTESAAFAGLNLPSAKVIWTKQFKITLILIMFHFFTNQIPTQIAILENDFHSYKIRKQFKI
jgi:hypothetical protein